MAAKDSWVSPDHRIRKKILSHGKAGLKPTENCECFINISDTGFDVEKYNEYPVVIGDSCNSFERLLDIVLTMMNEDEKAEIAFKLKESEINLILELKAFKSNGLIYEWDAKKKFELASKHKEVGVRLFRDNHYIDASHRFNKAFKLLASIPIAVDEPPTEVDGVLVSEVYSLKSILYNNLASCYLKHQDYETVIELCKKVLKDDGNNIKALYKLAISYYHVHDYHVALETLETLIKLDPNNKSAAEKLNDFVTKVNETDARVNAMFKKMFV